jgi:hypothetical protein
VFVYYTRCHDSDDGWHTQYNLGSMKTSAAGVEVDLVVELVCQREQEDSMATLTTHYRISVCDQIPRHGGRNHGGVVKVPTIITSRDSNVCKGWIPQGFQMPPPMTAYTWHQLGIFEIRHPTPVMGQRAHIWKYVGDVTSFWSILDGGPGEQEYWDNSLMAPWIEMIISIVHQCTFEMRAYYSSGDNSFSADVELNEPFPKIHKV